MKAEIVGVKKKEFRPITIRLTIESREELIGLLKRTNIPAIDINRYDMGYPDIPSNESGRVLWDLLDSIYAKEK